MADEQPVEPEEHPIFKMPESVRREIEEADAHQQEEEVKARSAGAAAAARRLGAPIPPTSPPTTDLDAHLRTRVNDSQESYEAARSLRDVTNRQRAVFFVLGMIGPATDDELIRAYERWTAPHIPNGHRCPMQSESGIRTRRHELVESGLVSRAGSKRLESGRYAATWQVREGSRPEGE